MAIGALPSGLNMTGVIIQHGVYGFAYKTVSPVMILILQIGPAHHAGSLNALLHKQQSRKHRTALIFTAFFIFIL
tara:strand:- start:521 stop:745 length:225 start_codon:yes stop_codon:yes gene_type:complete